MSPPLTSRVLRCSLSLFFIALLCSTCICLMLDCSSSMVLSRIAISSHKSSFVRSNDFILPLPKRYLRFHLFEFLPGKFYLEFLILPFSLYADKFGSLFFDDEVTTLLSALPRIVVHPIEYYMGVIVGGEPSAANLKLSLSSRPCSPPNQCPSSLCKNICSGVIPQRCWHSSPNLRTSSKVVSDLIISIPSQIGEHPATLTILPLLILRSRSFSCIALPILAFTICLMFS